jgi:hypothetical protein
MSNATTNIIDVISYLDKQLSWRGSIDPTREQKYIAIPREMAKALVEYYREREKERKINGNQEHQKT